MLGLSGIYTQTTMESLPYIRGLMSNVGLSFIPGTWINAINVSKGVGSVANGYESITGQIDIDMQKPFGVEGEKNGLFNFYGDNERRFEGNFNFRYMLNENISSITLAHASSRLHSQDDNHDNFLDMPTFNVLNLMQRWQYLSFAGWESQFGFQILSDKKEGGTISSITQPNNVYRFGSTNKLINLYGKTGYVFQENNTRSFGLQWSYNHYDNSSNYGNKKYDGKEKNLYLNFIYQTDIFNEANILRSGVSFVYDELRETFSSQPYDRIEKVPGAFLEYTYKPNEELSLVTGLRGDVHNEFGFLFTPRLHIRYSPEPDWVFRGALGRGYRTPNIFVEYSSSFTSSRQINILKSNNFGNGLKQESAWNYGINITHYFLYDYRDATLSLDFYRTNFDKTTIADMDSDPQKINFSSVNNGSYSNTFQVEMNIEPLLFFNVRAAYKIIDAKQFINNQWLDKPFTSKHRALLNFAYTAAKETFDDAQMLYDLTLQWFGMKRIPSTKSNPAALRGRESSPNFVLVNAQITRSFNELFDLYLGVENLFDFKQNDPIIDSANPNGQYFDASLIWGPVVGRMLYAGLRYKM
jgi:outer membrane receptor for ferrienterochelin and colicin